MRVELDFRIPFREVSVQLRQQGGAAHAAGTNTMRFQPIKIGTRSLHYLCRGRGSPTVIAEGGPGFSFSEAFARPKPSGWQIVFLFRGYESNSIAEEPTAQACP
jgi:hypothetical protein